MFQSASASACHEKSTIGEKTKTVATKRSTGSEDNKNKKRECPGTPKSKDHKMARRVTFPRLSMRPVVRQSNPASTKNQFGSEGLKRPRNSSVAVTGMGKQKTRSPDAESSMPGQEGEMPSPGGEHFLRKKAKMELDFKPGDLVWGKLKGYPWWPATVISWSDIKKKTTQPNLKYVYWFGDAKQSLVTTGNLKHFDNFKDYFSNATFSQMALYQTAVHRALVVAANRAGHEYPQVNVKTQCKELISWANDDFPPGGPNSIKQSKEDMSPDSSWESCAEVIANSEDEDIDLDMYTAKLKIMKEVRGMRVKEVKKRKKKLQDFCLICGRYSVVADHPLFEGRLCETCRVDFLKTAFLYDDDGYRSFCAICSEGVEVLLCGRTHCNLIFCKCCVDTLVGRETFQQELQEDPWICYMCRSQRVHGLLRRRKDWRDKLHQIIREDANNVRCPYRFVCPLVPVRERRPIRVLSLFDGISAVLVCLKKLGIKVDCYYSSEVCEQAIAVTSVQQHRTITHVPDIQEITDENLLEWGPIDLLIARCQISDINPTDTNPLEAFDVKQFALCPSVTRMFEFHRIFTGLLRNRNTSRPFFWLLESEANIVQEDELTISRFMENEPVILNTEVGSAIRRTRYFWGNLPGMNRPGFYKKRNQHTVQDCLEPNRQAQSTQLTTIVTKARAEKEGRTDLPVKVGGDEYDELWNIELERLFGFPEHYTEVGDLDEKVREKLLCESWSLPVIKHLLAPLKEYYACDV